jgi:protein subunit release factor A
MPNLSAEDLVIDTFPKPSGGGMQVGTIGSGVHITHKPSGIGVSSLSARSQHSNKEIALERLEFLLEFFGGDHG